MPITRTFLDWTQPPLPTVGQHLISLHAQGEVVDLSNLLIVVPGGRAGRRLQEILVDEAERRGLIVHFPDVVTQGALPERFYLEGKRFADDLTQQLAWVRALQQGDRTALLPYFPHLPDDDQFESWLPLAQMLSALHRELAADAHDFGDVVALGQELDHFPEAERWRALQQIQRQYLDILDSLSLWDKQTARLFAIRERECRTDRQVVLVGAVDLNRTARQMLDQVAENVTAIVFAPREHAHRFDEHGCLKPDLWPHAMVDIPDSAIRIASRPGDQADETLVTLAELRGAWPAEQIVIGIPDAALIPYLEQRLQSAALASRYGLGRTVGDTAWGRLFRQIADWLDEESFSVAQNLLRHPIVESTLRRRGVAGSWLTELDEYRLQHLPAAFAPPWLGDRTASTAMQSCFDLLRELFSEWRFAQQTPREWEPKLANVVHQLWDPELTDPRELADRDSVMQQLQNIFVKHQDLPHELTPRLSGAGYLRLMLSEIGREPIPPEVDPDAIELLGWLELPWDDAPVLIVTGMNEGIVPSSLNADLFLPNRLRQHLQLDDNDRRYARDAYALTLLTASREQLTLIAGRVSAQNDPLIPSRLLFGSDSDTLVRRTLRFFASEAETVKPIIPGRRAAGIVRAQFEPPRLDAYFEPVPSMRVTEFKDYLQCRYRYFLRHRLKLNSLISTGEELDGRAFGTVLHEVLEQFGQEEEVRGSRSEREIMQFLNRTLDRLMASFYGSEPEPAIQMQTERMRARLAAFAHWQAGWAEQGWRIEHVETAVKREHQAEFDVDGIPLILRGRIDRIDLNTQSGERMVFDYKTSNSANDPKKTHYKNKKDGGDWIDLQLPLYRHLARALGIETNLQLAYINLPSDRAAAGHKVAEWSEADLDSADERARQVVRDIRNNIFWPPSDDAGLMSEFAEICLESVIASDDSGGEDEA